MKEEIGKRIKTIRENLNMTKEEFAKVIGISGQYLGIVERGQSCLSIEKIKVLCDFTNLSSDFILFGKDENLINKTKKNLAGLTDAQLKAGCRALNDLAIFIRAEK